MRVRKRQKSVQNADSGVQNADSGVQNADSGVQTADFEVQSAAAGVHRPNGSADGPELDLGEADAGVAAPKPRSGMEKRASQAARVAAAAARYGVSQRTVRHWLWQGQKANAHAPIDDPHRMLIWWGRVAVRKSPPRGIREAAELAPPGETASGFGPDPAASPGDVAEPVFLRIDPAVDADMGLRQAQALVAATWQQLQAALAEGRSAATARLRREWKESVQTLRQWEKDITKIQEGKGEVVRTRVLVAELSAILGNIARSFDVALDQLAETLAPERPADERMAMARAHRDRVFAHLRGTRFEAAWEDTANGLT